VKPIGIINTTAFFLLVGIAIPVSARQDPPDKPAAQQQQAKPEKQQESMPAKKAQQAKPRQQQQQQEDAAKQKQQQSRGQQEQQQKQHQQQQENVAKQQSAGQEEQRQKQQQQATGQQQHSAKPAPVQQAHVQSQQEQHRQQSEQQGAWQERRAHNWQSEHRSWQQRGGYDGYRIPDDRYNGYFGPSHSFRIYSYPVLMVGGYPRFQYGGYWFGLADPWPEYWSNDWYDNDDVYVDYSGDGYYLYNRRYPSDRIAINVYLN